MRARGLAVAALTATSCAATPKPVMPPIFDSAIVLNQRVGPVSLGMSRALLLSTVGEPTSDVDYKGFRAGGASRRGLVYARLGLSLVLEDDTVVRISPSDGRYSTTSGIRVGAPLPANAVDDARARDGGGITSYCFDGEAAITVRTSADAVVGPGCEVGMVCDIVVGGCVP